MKVIFVIPNMCGGGAERVISVLTKEFVKNGIEVKIMMTAGDECVYELDPSVELYKAGERTGGSMIKRAARVCNMRKFIKANKDAILIDFESTSAIFTAVAKMGLPVKMIASERNDPASLGNPILRDMAFKMADKIVFQTEDAMNYFKDAIKSKGTIIPNPIKEDLPMPEEGIVRKKKIVAVGRLEPQKNHSMLIDAYREFRRKNKGYELHIYGDGYMREELQKKIDLFNLNNEVFLEGFRSDVIEQIMDAAMYILPSDFEGISNSLLEAMAIGLPVVATDCPCGGTAMCIEDGQNGFLTPIGNQWNIATAMDRIANDEELAGKLSQNAMKVRETFSAEAIAQKWIDVIEDIIYGRRLQEYR